ncbi:hypothetical protein [Agromyces marinus]|uniref:hypothetical protein n=1 Tax=Agromyces marinus TaxID=1389020 RepID=UPI001F2D0F99|nr:hypothetical protein [Agromyces marinus]UIP59711.1 hypothetical protein DSM26151_26250 [Agromyces marinus]
MRLREVWREAAHNFGSGASHGLVSTFAFLAIAVCLGSVASRGVVDVTADAVAFRDSGASVFRIDAPDDIDGQACDALAQVDGVDAAGATRTGSPLRFALLPDLPTPYYDATQGMARLLDLRNRAAGLFVDAELAESLGLGDAPSSSFLVGQEASTAIAATFDHPDDGRDSTLSGAAIGVTADGEPFDACWVRFWPPNDNPLEIMGTVIATPGGTAEAAQWNPTLGRTLDPRETFTALPNTALTIAAALIAAALAFVGVRLRRLELASARHVGVSRASLIGIALAEVAIWLIPACVLTLTALAFTATWHNPDPPAAAWLAGARIVIAASAAWLLTTALTTAAVRETHLVRYFQQR